MQVQEVEERIKKLKRTTLGVSVPEMRKLAKTIAKQNYQEFIESNHGNSFELRMVHAFVLGYANDDINRLLLYFKGFIPFVNDWAINDALCQNFKLTKVYPEVVWQFLIQYQYTEKEFESRIVSVMLLSHYLTDKYIDKVIKVLDKLNTDKYYAQMGVAWAIATIMGKYPEKCMNYLQSATCHLDKTTYNKTLQKIRESFRVSEEIKQKVKAMKLLPSNDTKEE